MHIQGKTFRKAMEAIRVIIYGMRIGHAWYVIQLFRDFDIQAMKYVRARFEMSEIWLFMSEICNKDNKNHFLRCNLLYKVHGYFFAHSNTDFGGSNLWQWSSVASFIDSKLDRVPFSHISWA